MSQRVDSSKIEGIVGHKRDRLRHYARAVSAEQTVYILHSQECLTSGIDLRECLFSLALDRGIDVARWPEDEPVHVHVERGRLAPATDDERPVTGERCQWISRERKTCGMPRSAHSGEGAHCGHNFTDASPLEPPIPRERPSR